MILPLADSLQNCLQNLTSRIAGMDNEQMTNRVVGMGAMLGFGMGAVKEQFNIPSNNNNYNGNSNSSSSGFKGFIDRAKSVINPTMNLSDEKDYNGNVNPIRNVIQKQNSNTNINNNGTNHISSSTMNEPIKEYNSNENSNSNKAMISKVAKTGFKATKAYLSMGAKMVEGDFSISPYNRSTQNNRKTNYQNTEYTNSSKELGDKDEPKEY